jgi:hypothetical protein
MLSVTWRRFPWTAWNNHAGRLNAGERLPKWIIDRVIVALIRKACWSCWFVEGKPAKGMEEVKVRVSLE